MPTSSTRTDRPVSSTVPIDVAGSSCKRVPTGADAGARPALATMTTVRPVSSRAITVAPAPSSCSTSSATAENTSAGGTPVATSVATRRSADCSPASRSSSRSARRRSVTSRATPYTTPSSAIAAAVHSSTRAEPSARMKRFSNVRGVLPSASAAASAAVVPRSSGCTNSRYGRSSSSFFGRPRIFSAAGFTRVKCPSKSATAIRSGERVKMRSSSSCALARRAALTPAPPRGRRAPGRTRARSMAEPSRRR